MTPERTKEEILKSEAKKFAGDKFGMCLSKEDYFEAGAKWQESQCSPVESYTRDQVIAMLKDQRNTTIHHLGFSSGVFVYPTDYEAMCKWMMRAPLVLPELPSPTIEETKEK